MPPTPSLRVRRIVVEGALALDLTLLDGVNVLWAPVADQKHSNKAGKTGLVELIQYGLGRAVRRRATFHFAPVQSSLETLWLELICNGQTLTIRRSLQRHTAGVVVFPVPYSPDLRDRSGDGLELSALSDFLLGRLGIPRVEVSQQDGRLVPLSLPTLMRAFILHQDDSFGAILDKVDPESRRGDILGLLTGTRPQEVYALEVSKGKARTRAATLEQSYTAVREFLSGQGVSSLEGAQERVRAAQQAVRASVQTRQAEQGKLRSPHTATSAASEPYAEAVSHTDALRGQLIQIQARRAALESEALGYRQERARLRQLIASLEVDQTKARRLHVSSVVLSSFEFDVCPRCTQEVTADMRARELRHRCALCSRPLTVTSESIPRTAPAADDIAQQLDEARQMVVEASADATATERALEAIRQDEQRIAEALNMETAVYVSPAVDTMLALSQDVARAEAELADAARLLRQAEGLRDLYNDLQVAQRAAVEADAALLAAQLEGTRRLADLEEMYRAVLRDLEFPDVARVEIDQLTLMPYLDGQLYIHRGAALRGLAVVAYHLALLRLSLTRRTFFPRFLVIDSPAVGDLNQANHDRLLRYLAEINEGAWSDDGKTSPPWQLILTTRRMVAELRPHVRMRLRAVPGEMLLRPPTDDSGSEGG